MLFEFTIGSAVLFLSGFIPLVLAIVIWRRRKSPGAILFFIFLLAMIWWLYARILQAAAVDFDDKIFWAITTYIGIVCSAILWTCFALEYSCNKYWKRSRYLPLLFIVPVLAVLSVIGSLHFDLGQFNDILMADQTGSLLIWTHGLVFWIQIAYLSLLVIVGLVILGRFMLRRSSPFRHQFFILFAGTFIPGLSMLLYSLRILPSGHIDWLPLTFILGGLIYALTIFRFKFLELIPTARGKLVENMEDGILVLNSEGGIADLNPATEKIIGANRLDILGKRLDSVWPKLDLIKTNLNRGQHAEMAGDKGGKAQYLDISVIDLKGDEEKLEGELVVMRDMTERREIVQALRESESRYATLIEQSNEGVLIIQDGVYKFANRTMTEISGYPVNELVGKTIPFAIAEEDRRIIQERYNLRLSGQTVPQFYEIKLVRKDGEKRDIEISIGSITYEGHSADMVTVRDVTERRSTQRKLELSFNAERHLSNSLREEMEKRSKYTRALVHELRTPLTSIMVSGELLEEEVKDHLFLELIKNIRRSSFKLQQRISELLELARGEIGMLKINAGPLDMEKLLREGVSEMSPIAAAKGLTIILEITNLPLVMGDKTRLSEVMSNLLSNAIKFTSSGVVTVTAASDDSGQVLVSVKDTGRGIDEERIKNLFDPYLRKESYEGQDLGGLGIGLALCKLFVELHGGKIWVESQPGSGTVFSFTIPISRNSNVDTGDSTAKQMRANLLTD